MTRSTIMAAVVVGISLLIPSAWTAARTLDKPPGLTVELLSANGSGCRAGSAPPVTADTQPSGAVTVTYPNFAVSGGDYRTCVVVLKVAAKAGWTYLIPSAENRAWAELGAGGTASLATSMWFTGFSWTVTDDKQAAGPLKGQWATTATPGQPAWAPCAQSVNLSIAETLRVAEAQSNTVKLLATTLGPVRWKRC